ncbi:MAG: 50S ribosomal protein L5 [Opitutales bacterium]
MEKPYLYQIYLEQIRPDMLKEHGWSNLHEVPKLEKIVINSGIKATKEKSWFEEVRKDISSLAGQKAVLTKATKSVSNFKLREGMPIGVRVTLRGARMYEFLLRLTAVALPNIRDFRGIHRKLDGRGNYTLGITDHTIFPEINSDTQGKETIGMDITFVTTATTDAAGFDLLKRFGMPFRRTKQEEEEANKAA